MAEWSKAPDSSRGLVALSGSRVFWSPNGGVENFEVRMAEWSKAPDSSRGLVALSGSRVFWSPNGGVGSNPTSDITFGNFYFTYMLTLCRIALKWIVKLNIEKLMS
ncbi:unnamed protein product [Clavelina lepadiformis]|uniref:Uncharacterized protein n=1 Tax=Clavelina lepadiformis TaxID=159417 RepID=A0ABP0F093_CLALP